MSDREDLVLQAYRWANSSAGQGDITLTAAERHELVIQISAQVDEGTIRPRNIPKLEKLLRTLLERKQP